MPADNVTTLPWRNDRCQFTANGVMKKNLFNAATFLRDHPALRGRFAFDEFAYKVRVMRPLPWDDEIDRDWTAMDDSQSVDFDVPTKLIAEAVEVVARENRVHPVRAYLNGLAWDGLPRLDKWLSYYLGAEQTDYLAAVGRAWMISAVARVMEPGCKADHMLILEGPQGLKKSTAIKALAGEDWFTDEIAEFGSKDAAMQIRGVWIVEIAELDAMSKSEATRVKAFLTRTTDRFRPPYGARMITSARECIFAGTTNEMDYFRDASGARRFWPVECGPKIDLQGLRADRDQLWAEAVSLYNDGAPWWITSADIADEAREEQRSRYEEDPWTPRIMEWIDERFERDHFKIDEILTHAVGLQPKDTDQRAQKRVAGILRLNGFKRKKVRQGGRGAPTPRLWVRVNDP